MATRPLILAIEPDRRQAACLSSVARRISVELLLVESVAEALPALQDQLPHLILTPTLLPCRDDTMLTAWLRELGDAATHIQRLTTPLLEADAPRRGRGLSPRRRDKKLRTTSPVACKAETFAEQLAIYLESAVAAHGARRRTQAPPPEDTPVSEALPEPPPSPEDAAPIAPSDDPPQFALDPPEFALPVPELFASEAVQLTLTPLPHMSLRIEAGVSSVDALPHVPEAMCRVDALVSALAGGAGGDVLVHAPPIAQSGIVELPSIRASHEAETPHGDASGFPYVLPPPAVLPQLPDVPAIGPLPEAEEGSLTALAPSDPPTLPAPVPVPSPARTTANATSRRRPVKTLPAVRPNGRMLRKIMRRMYANDWTP